MKSIVFVCNGNTARSQMAEAFFKRHNKNPEYTGISAGLNPGKSVKKEAIEVMREKGIDISMQNPKQLTEDMSQKAEQIIAMGGVSKSRLTPLDKTTDWDLEDIEGKHIQKYREIRDAIEKRVISLVARLSKKKGSE